MAQYKAAFLFSSGAIECGHGLRAQSDADALRMARGMALDRRASLFGLHEVTGRTASGVDLIRPVAFSAGAIEDRPAPRGEAGEAPAFDIAERVRMGEAVAARDAFEAWAEGQ